jgi:hypothetical protein
MKTLNHKSKNNKVSFIICIILLAIHSSVFSQNKMLIVAASINLQIAFPIMGVLGLFTFLLYAFMKQKNH